MATEKRLIDANALKKQKTILWDEALGFCDCVLIENIDDAPTVDAVEVVHGHWVSDEGDVLFHCSECETQISTSWDYDDLQWNYCPSCGAEMC